MSRFRSSFDLRSIGWLYAAALMATLMLGSIGCRQRAYNELYVESMATEIRLLEDRVYEYDAEYRALENELHDLQAINEGLEAKLRDADQQRIDLRGKPKSTPPKTPPPKESLRLPSNEDVQLDVQTPEPPPVKKPSATDTEELLPRKAEPKLPEPKLPEPKLPEPPSSVIPAPNPTLLPDPSLLPGGASTAPRGLPSDVRTASFEERRIDAPTLPPTSNTPAVSAKGTEIPQDQRVREIDFHPGLCRGLNQDGQPGEEGIALVLMPRNAQRAFVPSTGKVVVVMEESGDNGTRRLGAWEFSPEEIAERIEPLGSAQGIHLQLLWKDKAPETQVVELYVRFTDAQGITSVNHRQIHLRKSAPGQSTWTPL